MQTNNTTKQAFKAALFDLDGVVFDTEPQYSIFWGSQCRLYHPEQPGLENRIKGQTLTQIYDGNFADMPEAQKAITARLNEFEQQMHFDYLPGLLTFIDELRQRGIKTAVVTSSNTEKMSSVYRQHPEFKGLFDAILTEEDFAHSKPHPDCYLRAAARFSVPCGQCIVFEDSFNGLRSGRAAEMAVVGLSTTNPAESIAPLADVVIADYQGLNYEILCEKLSVCRKK
ncbi:MAG: HAD family hydrolase [Prevotella sp.]|nr:HAD family hydrolase [Prevotella sp.]